MIGLKKLPSEDLKGYFRMIMLREGVEFMLRKSERRELRDQD
jgi:hypothetical protein